MELCGVVGGMVVCRVGDGETGAAVRKDLVGGDGGLVKVVRGQSLVDFEAEVRMERGGRGMRGVVEQMQGVLQSVDEETARVVGEGMCVVAGERAGDGVGRGGVGEMLDERGEAVVRRDEAAVERKGRGLVRGGGRGGRGNGRGGGRGGK